MKKLFAFLLLSGIISFIPSSLHLLIPSSLQPLFSSSLSAQIPSNGLVAWYPFNGNASDESGNGNDGTVNGATLTADRYGNANEAYYFNLPSGHVSIPNITNQLSTSNLTISLWFKKEGNYYPGTPRLIDFGSTHPGIWSPEYDSNNDVINYYWPLTGAAASTEAMFSKNSNWHHLIISFHEDSNYLTEVYLDGQLANTTCCTNIGVNGMNLNWLIGRGNSGQAVDQWVGKIDDISIFNRAITSSEALQLYQDQTGQLKQNTTCLPAYVPTNGLVGYWPFCGNANDESGNGNNLANNGGVLVADRNNDVQKAYSFSNGYADLTSSVFNTPSFSYSAWVNPSVLSNGLGDIGGTYFDWQGYFVGVQNGVPHVRVHSTSTTLIKEVFSSQSISANTWSLITGTFDGLMLKIYVNGVNTGSLDVGNYQFQNRGAIAVGRSPWVLNDGGASFPGNVDDVAVYNRALTATEIQQMYQGQIIQNLTCNITAPTTTLCAGESVNLSISATGGAGSSSQLPANLQQGLVAYYPFNGNANDESGNGNNGTVNGATLTADRNGNPNSAYYFSSAGCATRIDAQVNTSSIQNELTISVWINRIGNGCIGPRILEFWANNGPGQAQWGWDNGNGRTFGSNTSSNYSAHSIFNIVPNNTWTLLTYTNNGSQANFYQDGVLINSIPSSGQPILSGNLAIGRMNHPAYDAFNGNIDDLAVYNRALSPSEVQQLYIAQSYAWNTGATTNTITVTPTTNTTYSCTVTQGAQTCTASVDITVYPAVTNAISATIIEGESYTLGTQTLTTAGTYTEVFTSAEGCDSTVTLTLAVEPLLTCNITAPTTTLCAGESLDLIANINSGNSALNYLHFNGIDSRVEILNQLFNGGSTSSFTIEGWVRTNNQNQPHGTIFSKAADWKEIQFRYPNGNFSFFYAYPYSYQAGLSGGSLSSSEWSHVAVQMSGNSAQLYLNGVLITQASSNGIVDWSIFSGSQNLGSGLWGGVMNYFDGDIAQFRISSIARYSGQNFTATQNWLNDDSTELLYKFNEGSGNVLNDYSGKGNNGQIINATWGNGNFSNSFLWSTVATTNSISVTPTTSTTYSCTVTQGNSTCTASIDITVNPAVNNDISATIIEGETYTLGTQTLTTAGTYTEVFTSAEGCDSTVTLTLAVEPLLTCNITAPTTTLCAGESVNLSISATGGAGISSQLPANLQQGLVAYYPFNGNANDESGNGNNGTVNGATLTADRFGNANGAYGFNGTSNYVSIPNSTNLQLTNSMSFSVWVNVLNWYGEGQYFPILCKSNDISVQGRYELTLTNSMISGHLNSVWGGNSLSTSFPLQLWKNIVYVLNANSVDIYIDGIKLTGSYIQANTNPVISTDPLIIGKNMPGLIEYANGEIDDLLIYNRALSASEVQQLYTSQSYVWNTGATTSSITVTPTTNSTYSCTVTQGAQTCSASVDITVSPQQTFYADADADGYGNPQVVVTNCNQPAGYVTDNTDCNDNDASVYVASTETCNGLDDNCDGQVDEGLTLGSVTATSVTTALYPTCSGNALKSANLNNGNNSPIIEGNGLDLWYSMTAQYNTLRASLSAAFGDNEIRLYSYNNGCFELMETEHEVYTASTAATGNQVLITDDLLVGQTYYIAVHNISGAMNTSAKMCFNHFVGSACDHYYSNNTSIYPNVCTSFKAQYKGNATNYIFDILSATQNNANLNITPWSYTTTTANSVVPRLGTIFPVNMSNAAKVYTLRIPVIYAIPDAAGNYTSITANATTTCTVTLNAELPIALRAADRCPNTKTTTSSISVDRTICGAQRYEWEFTQQLPSVQSPITVLGGLNTTVFFLNNVPGMGTGKTYNVRVRPIHANGEVGNWGTAQCLKTGTSGMVMQSESAARANNYSPEQAVTLFPNPTSTGHFTLMSNASEEEVKQIVITDITGKMVFQSQVVLNSNSVEVEFGDLATGMYLVMVGEERLRLIVE